MVLMLYMGKASIYECTTTTNIDGVILVLFNLLTHILLGWTQNSPHNITAHTASSSRTYYQFTPKESPSHNPDTLWGALHLHSLELPLDCPRALCGHQITQMDIALQLVLPLQLHSPQNLSSPNIGSFMRISYPGLIAMCSFFATSKSVMNFLVLSSRSLILAGWDSTSAMFFGGIHLLS